MDKNVQSSPKAALSRVKRFCTQRKRPIPLLPPAAVFTAVFIAFACLLRAWALHAHALTFFPLAPRPVLCRLWSRPHRVVRHSTDSMEIDGKHHAIPRQYCITNVFSPIHGL